MPTPEVKYQRYLWHECNGITVILLCENCENIKLLFCCYHKHITLLLPHISLHFNVSPIIWLYEKICLLVPCYDWDALLYYYPEIWLINRILPGYYPCWFIIALLISFLYALKCYHIFCSRPLRFFSAWPQKVFRSILGTKLILLQQNGCRPVVWDSRDHKEEREQTWVFVGSQHRQKQSEWGKKGAVHPPNREKCCISTRQWTSLGASH